MQATSKHKNLILNEIYKKKVVIDWKQWPVMRDVSETSLTFPTTKNEIHTTCLGHISEEYDRVCNIILLTLIY